MKEKRFINDPAYSGPERRSTHDHCDKVCDNHSDIQTFKETMIGKMSKCITGMGILFLIFGTGIAISSGSYVKATQNESGMIAIEERIDKNEREHIRFEKAIEDIAVVKNDVQWIKRNMQKIINER